MGIERSQRRSAIDSVIAPVLYRLSYLFGEGPMALPDVRWLMNRYTHTAVRERVKIWARLICLQPILKAIDRHVPDTAERLVDLGSGYGLISLMAALRRKARILGIEASPVRVAIAKMAARELGQVTFQCGDVAQIPVPPGDALLLIDILSYFTDETQGQILAACADSLKPGGILLIKDNTTVPQWKYRYVNVEERIKRTVGVYGVTAQIRPNHHPPELWRQLIRSANLEVCDEILIESVVPYPGIIYVCQKLERG
ncbi:MAG: class I SAM-dependent methyltransferase [Candidatus Poribacteria bacterium]|nr:class I SAM-dependent methyltransferase [Candidatus Poribacteria bacterium]